MYIGTSRISEVAMQAAMTNSASSEPEATPSERVLVAIEIIGKHGPLTHKALANALNLSKATTWRLVATLHDAKWVRFRHGGRLIELDPRVDDLFANAHFADAEFLELSELISEFGAQERIHIDLFAPNHMGELVLHETSRRLTSSAPVPEATDDQMLLAVYAAMTPPQLERHLAQVAAELDVENARYFTGPAARRRIQQFPGYFWGANGRYLAVSLRGKMGTAAVLRLSTKANMLKPEVLAQSYERLVPMLATKVAVFGSGRQSVEQP